MLLPTIINNDNLFYLSLAATLLLLPLHIRCRSARRRAAAAAVLPRSRHHCRRANAVAAALTPLPLR
jgi:hypothetical protein